VNGQGLLSVLLRTLVAVALGSYLATQLYAWLQAYHPALGQPLVLVSGWPLYGPHKLYVWAWQWGQVQPQPFVWPAVVVVGVTVGLVCLGVQGGAPGAPASSEPWQTKRTLRKAGLRAPYGVVLGRWRRQPK
jgi:type IV secretion system protein VirD4